MILPPVNNADHIFWLPREHAPKWGWGFVLACIFCGVAYFYIDLPLAQYLKTAIGPDTARVFYAITDAGLGGPWFGLSAALAALGYIGVRRAANEETRNKFCALRDSFLFMFTAQAASGVFVVVSKVIIGRMRPRYFFNDGLYGFEPFNFQFGMNSFPSGHSQTAWASMVALMILFPRFRIPFLIAAIIISASRSVLNVHFASDVVMGSFLGAVMTVMVWSIFRARGIRVGFNKDRNV